MKRFMSQKAYLVSLLLMSVFISALAGCGGGGGGSWTDPGAAGAGNPTVTSTVPVNGATGVVTNSAVIATFSGAMDPATITTTTFTVKQGATAVPGTVAYSGVTAVFTPTSNLAVSTGYTATITTGAKNLAGKALANNFVWSFTTGLVADSTLPRVTATINANGAIGVPINTKVGATFSEAMNPITISTSTFTLQRGATPVSGTVAYSGVNAVFTPTGNLLANTLYTATITTGAKDLAGNALAGNQAPLPAASNFVWSWTTGATPDITSPTVTITTPVNVATGVAINSVVRATFSEAMDPLTISTATFTLKAGANPGTVGLVTYNQNTRIATFAPSSPLSPSTTYTATITIGAKDLAGNVLAPGLVPNPWTFTTAAAVPPGAPLAINLGRAASFGIASRAGLTSTGVTVVNGDIALSPNATCSDATGGPGGSSQTCLSEIYSSPTGMTVNGSIYWAGDPFDSGVTADKVTTDLTAAWNEGMAKVNTQPAIAAGELGGKTFIPGVYENANLTLSAGGVATLDAQNNPNAIFIFKTTLGGDFVDSGTLLLPSRIVLTGQAQARNVWFVIGRDATIGSGTTWNGNILANRTATILDGSTVNGRVLGGAGGAGAITLTGAAAPSRTTITVPQ